MKRMFFNKKRYAKENSELDITSLLDVLVILLVFLLKSYNASDLKLDLVKNLTLPDSEQRKLGSQNIVVQIDKNQSVFVDNQLIGSFSQGSTQTKLMEILKNDEEQKPTKKVINLVFDQDTPYSIIQQVMNSSSQVGYSQFKFIVKGNY